VQNVQQVENQLQIAQVDADSNIRQATVQAAIQLATANATAIGILAQAQTNAQAVRLSVTAQITAFQLLRQRLNLTTSAQLLSYMWTSAIQSNQAQKIVIEWKYPSIISSFLSSQNQTNVNVVS